MKVLILVQYQYQAGMKILNTRYNIGVKFKHSFYSIEKSQWFGKAFFLLTTGLTKTLEVVVSVKWLHLEYCYQLADKCSF
jgi:hypothetical protein